MRAAERAQSERAAAVFWDAVLEQIEGGIDRLRRIKAAAAVGVMPVDQLAAGFPKLV